MSLYLYQQQQQQQKVNHEMHGIRSVSVRKNPLLQI